MARQIDQPSDWELRLFKSNELSTERELEIMDLLAVDEEIERRLVAAHPLSADELLARRARALDGSADGETSPPTGNPLVSIRKPWRELFARIRESLPSAGGAEFAWGVRSGPEPDDGGPDDSVPLFAEERFIDDVLAEISATLVRRRVSAAGRGRSSTQRFLQISVFDTEAQRGVAELTVTVTPPFFTQARTTTDQDGIAEFRIAIGGDWISAAGATAESFGVDVYRN